MALWHRNLSHNPGNPAWPNRDRFVLSNGHGSMLLYSLLHLTGYDLPMAELKRFRQLHSKTPGHPEYRCAPGVETTTGPLGQGISNAVGMAIAERLLAAEFNRPGLDIVDHHTYVFLGDGCMMEGVSHEACALAGTLGLGKLIAVYDDNGISIDSEKGNIRQWYTDDVRRALRGLRLAGDPQRRRPRRRGGRPRAQEGEARDAPPDADLREDGHRQGRAHQGEHRRRARRAARREGNRRYARGDRLAPSGVRDSRRRARGLGREGKGQARRAALEARVQRPTRRRIPIWRRSSCAVHAGELPSDFQDKVRALLAETQPQG